LALASRVEATGHGFSTPARLNRNAEHPLAWRFGAHLAEGGAAVEHLFARLPWHASITDDYNNCWGRFNLEFWALTEEQIQAIAAALKPILGVKEQ